MLFLLLVIFISSREHQTFKSLNIYAALDIGSRSHIGFVLDVLDQLKEKHKITYVGSKSALGYSQKHNFSKINLGEHLVPKDGRASIKKQNSNYYDFALSIISLSNLLGKEYTKRVYQMFEIIENGKPDLIICDFFFLACIDAARYKKIPLVIGFQWLDVDLLSPATHITTTAYMKASSIEKLNLLERIKAKVISTTIEKIKIKRAIYNMKIKRKKLGFKLYPSLFGNFHGALKIVNSFVGFEYSRKLDTSTKLIGPIINLKNSEISVEVKTFLKTHKKILYISFGSGNIIPEHQINNILAGIIYAYELSKIDGMIWGLGPIEIGDFPTIIKLKNKRTIHLFDLLNNNDFVFVKWAPQYNILKHKNTLIFISHAGLESSFEAMLTGTPVLALPYFGDQPRNAYKIQEFNLGRYLNPKKCTSEQIYEELSYILNSTEIKAGVKNYQVLTESNKNKLKKASILIENYAFLKNINKEKNILSNSKDPNMFAIKSKLLACFTLLLILTTT